MIDSQRAHDRWLLRICETSILALTVLGWILSYSALRRLAERHGYAGWEANLWPLTVDLLATAAAGLAIVAARRGLGPTGEAWALAGLAAAATLVGNVLSAGNDLVAQALHAWPAICMLGAWHLFFRSIAPERAPKRASEGRPRRAVTRKAARTSTRARVLQLETKARAQGRQLTGREIADQVGINPGHARRVRAQVRAPKGQEVAPA